MANTNRNLGILCLVLLAASAWVYTESVSRGERFERGQKFLQGLDVDQIATILVQEPGGDGEESVSLKRSGENFTITEAKGYLAKNQTVNRFLKDLLDIGLEKEVGEGEKLARELELEPPGEETLEVTLKDTQGEEMVRFRVGKAQEDGSGRFIQRLDGEDRTIYLTSAGVYLTTDRSSFLNKEILNVNQSEIARIEGPDFLIEDVEDGGLKLAEVPPGQKEKSAGMSKAKSVLSYLNFDKVYQADDPEVSGLGFRPTLYVQLKDTTGYQLSVATQGDRRFLTIRGLHDVDRVEIAMDESEDELKGKADLLTRVDEINAFNQYHGSWVYEVTESVAGKLELTRSELVEGA